MRLNPAAFDAHLKHMGQKVLWRRAYACACLNHGSGQPDPKHALCSGKGRIWDPPQETVVGVASQETNAKWVQSGLWETGDMVLSIPQASVMYDCGQYDRITMLNSSDPFSQPLTRGAPTERLPFAVEKITRVFWLDPSDRNRMINGGLAIADANGNLSWPDGGEPPPGVTYSVTGTKFSEYFVFDRFTSDRGEHGGARLPKKLVARKYDLFGR